MKSLFIFLILFSITSLTSEAQLAKNKAVYKYMELGCRIEREEADDFDYEDKDIKFKIIPDHYSSWTISIENKTKHDMIVYWRDCSFVINKISGSILFVSSKDISLEYHPPYEEKIAPESIFGETYFAHNKLTKIIDPKIIKKTGEDYYIRLIIPIEVNGELKKYDFKYRIYLANAEKQQKYKEKKQKKIKKELEKVIKQHQGIVILIRNGSIQNFANNKSEIWS